jgi:hypothetical protein
MAGKNKMAGKTKWREKTKWQDKTKLAEINKMAGVKWRDMLSKRAEGERWHVVAHLYKIWRETIGEREKSAGKCRRTELLFKWVADKINSRCAK